MSSLFKSTLNTRHLPIGDTRYIRTDAPLSLTEEEVAWLLDNEITILVDLRSKEEVDIDIIIPQEENIRKILEVL